MAQPPHQPQDRPSVSQQRRATDGNLSAPNPPSPVHGWNPRNGSVVERRSDSPNPFALIGTPDPTPSIMQPLENLQNQIRTQLRQVLGIGQPSEPPTTLQQIAHRFRTHISGSAQLNVPLAETTQNRTPLVQALNLPPNQEDLLNSQIRSQIAQVLSQSGNASQNEAVQNLVARTSQLNTLQGIENQLRTPLLQALNLPEQELLNQNQARIQALRNAINVSLTHSRTPVSQSSSDQAGLMSSFSGLGLIFTVNQELLGSKLAAAREDYIFLSDCSFRAHRHEELLAHVRAFLSVTENRRDLLKEERYFVAVAYKDSVRNIRDAWRKIRKIGSEDKRNVKAEIANAYRAELECKMRAVCAEGLLVSGKLLDDPIASLETRMYFYKVKGDLCRYMAEYATGAEKVESAALGKVAYEEADRLKTCVSCVHPLRLGLALNFGVFLRDACQDSNRGLRITKVALDDANRGFQMLAELDANDYRESNGLLMNLRRNLMRWNTAEIDMETQNRTRSGANRP